MGERSGYPAGVPCWVETLQPDPRAARDFYGPLFGWEFRQPAPEHFVATVGGRDVAGVAPQPASGAGAMPAVWSTALGTDDVDAAVERARAASGSLLLGPIELPGGRRAVLADPTGAAFVVLAIGAGGGAQLVNEPSTWMMSSLHTPAPAVAGAFYRQVFGWVPEPAWPGSPVTFFRLPGHVGGEPGQTMPRDVVAVMTPTGGPDGPAVPPHWSVNFRVADADAVAARAAELGGRVLLPPTDAPGSRSAVLLDPQNAVFSVSQVRAAD